MTYLKAKVKDYLDGRKEALEEVRNILKNMVDDGFINNPQYTLILHNLKELEGTK